MANYTTKVTDAGAALLTRISNSAGTLQWRAVKCGQGQIGAGDPEALTDIIDEVQSFDVVDVKYDGNGVPYEFAILDNDGLLAAYTRWEIGFFGRELADEDDTLVIYLYAETEPEADYIPAESEGAAVQTMRVQLVAAQGLTAEVALDQSTVFLALDRWADHLAGAGGADQHPAATNAVPGLMAAADKAKVDAHINLGAPSSGTAVHAVATQAVAGFESAADKTKLDGIQAGAEVNQNAYAIVRAGGVNIAAAAKNDSIELLAGANIALTPDAGNKRVTVAATGLAPIAHVGSGGNAHANASGAVAGFMSAADKTRFDAIPDPVYTPAAGTGMRVGLNAGTHVATIGVGLAHYSVRANWWTGGITMANLLAHANTRLVGLHISPGGGIVFSSRRGDGTTAIIFEMLVNNVSGASKDKELYVQYVDDNLWYQIDAGAPAKIISGPAGNQAPTITIPAGEHTVRFYLDNDHAEHANLVMADWLDADVIWTAGGVYW